MKKKTLQKVLALVLTGAMAVSMVACGSKDTPASTSASTETSTAASTENTQPATEGSESTEAGIAGFTAFDNTVTLRIPIYQRATPNGAPDAANNYWTKWVQENFGDKYNINVEYVPIARGTENESYALFAADKTLPVVCFEYDYPDAVEYYTNGYFDTYDVEWFKSIAPTYWQQMVDNGLDAYTEINGDNVLLVSFRPEGESTYTYVTFYRKDWVNAAGYDTYPTDPDEELKMLAKVKELGLGGEHLLGGTETGGNGADQNHGWRDYPLDEELWATTGDYAVPALSTEAQKKFLQNLNTKYNLGYIDPEYNTRTSDFAISDFVNGDTISYSCYVSPTITVLDQFYETNPDAELAMVVNPGPEQYACGASTAFRAGGPFGEYIGFSSQATDDEKKAFAMYLEWMIQPETLFTLQWGFEGVNFEYNENGDPVSIDQTGKEEIQGHNNNVDMWCLITAIRSLGSIEKDIKSQCPTGYPDSETFLQNMMDNYKGQLACAQAGLVSVDCQFKAETAAVSEYKNTLFDKYAELRDGVVMGSTADFEANYEAASKAYLEAGYQAIIDEKAELLKAGKSTTLADVQAWLDTLK